VLKYFNRRLLNFLLDTNQLLPLYIDILKRDGLALGYLNQDLTLTYSYLVDIALEQNPLALKYVPKSLRTQERCAAAFAANKNCYEFIPDAYKTCEMSQAAVRENPNLILKVPASYQSDELWLEAARVKPEIMQHHTTEFMNNNRDLFERLFNEDPCNNYQRIPDQFKTEKMTKEYFLSTQKKIGLFHYAPSLEYVPKHLLTPEICDLAFAASAWQNFYRIPDQMKTREMCMIYLQVRAEDWQRIPQQFMSQEMYEFAFNYYPTSYHLIPDANKTIEMTSTFFERYPHRLSDIPAKHLVSIERIKVGLHN
jgi:hypothetical protein